MHTTGTGQCNAEMSFGCCTEHIMHSVYHTEPPPSHASFFKT